MGTSKEWLKPKSSACSRSDVVAEVQTDVREGRVAGDLQRLLEGDLAAEAGAAVVVRQVGGRAGQVEDGRAPGSRSPSCTPRWTARPTR